MAPKLSHLNPGFKVVYASIAMAEDVSFFTVGAICAPALKPIQRHFPACLKIPRMNALRGIAHDL